MNKKELREANKIANLFTKEEFPNIVGTTGKFKLKAFIICLKKKPEETKSLFMIELYKKEKDLNECNKILEELDRFIIKVKTLK